MLGSVVYAPTVLADGSIPASCSQVNGVIVCTDNSVTNKGSVCITASDGTQSCLASNGSGVGASLSELGRGLGSVVGSPPQITGTGWLSRITGWLAFAFNKIFAAFAQLLKDLVTYVLVVVFDVVKWAINSISVPSWITTNSLGSLLAQAGSTAGFFMVQLKIPQALGLIGLGYAFRLIRKFVTLFQW